MKRLLSIIALSFLTLTTLFAQAKDRYVFVVSMDGFRADYIDKARTPNFDKMARHGVSAVMTPSYPASTFPNHYTLATGLYPDHNGIVNNTFWDPEHQNMYKAAGPSKCETYFYLGEPIWNTVQRQGVIAATCYWVGSEFPIGGKLPRYYKRYVRYEIIPNLARIDTTLAWLRKPEEVRPHLVMLYFNEPDHTGHMEGPGSKATVKKVREMDRLLGRIRKGIAKLPIADQVDLIVLSDHGMADVSPERCVSADNNLKKSWTERIVYGTPTSIFSTDAACRDSILTALSGLEHLYVWKKEDIPAELHYGTSNRIGDIVVAPELGWRFSDRPGSLKGAHGFFPSYPEMQVVFRAVGPDFKKGYKANGFRNVSIYPLICHLLQIEPSPNDGALEEVQGMLK